MEIPTLLRKAVSPLLQSRVLNQLADGALYQPLILFFHGVEEQLRDERLQVLQSTLADFEPLMRHLKQHFEVISCDDLHERLQSGQRHLRRCVLLTFDDGYENNARLLAPLLGSMGLPFTIYLTTGLIGTGELLPTFIARAALFRTTAKQCVLPGIKGCMELGTDAQRGHAIGTVSSALKSLPTPGARELVEALKALLSDAQWSEIREEFASETFMTWDQVRETMKAGATIGSHCHDHFPLHAMQSADEVHHQIITSRDLIAQQTGACHHFAFPNGQPADIGHEAVVQLRRAGFRTATSTVPGALTKHCHPLLLPRSCVYTVEELNRRVLRSRVDGSARFLTRWQSSFTDDRSDHS